MNRDEEESIAFFKQLQGKPPEDGSSVNPSINALRKALLTDIEILRSSEKATAADFSQQERELMTKLKQKLTEHGLLGVSSAHPSSTITQLPRLQHLKHIFLGDTWHRPVALAASLILGIAVIYELVLPPSPDVSAVRGAATQVVVTTDPATLARVLAERLQGIGAEVIIVQLNKEQWSMHISVPKSVDFGGVQNIFNESGIRIVGLPPYELILKSK